MVGTRGIIHVDPGAELTAAEFTSVTSHSIASGTAFPTDPAPVEMDLFYRTDQHKLYIYNGTDWKTCVILTAADVPTGVDAAKLQSYDVQAHAPQDGEYLKWVNANNRWEPATM